MNLEKGGRGAIERMVEAYGFKTSSVRPFGDFEKHPCNTLHA